jgi:multimeric flavodoxin WrbA
MEAHVKNGNTRAVTAIVMAAAKESGAEVSEIDFINLDFKAPGCVGCQKCQHSEAFACAFNDKVAQNVATLKLSFSILIVHLETEIFTK